MASGSPGRPRILDASAEELRRLYWDKEMTTYDIAEEHGVDHATVIVRMEQLGIPRRRPGPIPG